MKQERRDEEAFVIRGYSKVELALLYHPDMKVESATRKLNRWIHGNPMLMERLREVGMNPKRWSYTPKEVALIVEYLGEPG